MRRDIIDTFKVIGYIILFVPYVILAAAAKLLEKAVLILAAATKLLEKAVYYCASAVD